MNSIPSHIKEKIIISIIKSCPLFPIIFLQIPFYEKNTYIMTDNDSKQKSQHEETPLRTKQTTCPMWWPNITMNVCDENLDGYVKEWDVDLTRDYYQSLEDTIGAPRLSSGGPSRLASYSKWASQLNCISFLVSTWVVLCVDLVLGSKCWLRTPLRCNPDKKDFPNLF